MVLDKSIASIFPVLILIFCSTFVHGAEPIRKPDISCQEITWHDVEKLVQPYLSGALYTALVMQAQSMEYHPSAAARQAMDKSLPENVKRTLRSIIKAGC